MPNDKTETTTTVPTYGSGYYPGRSFAGYPGAYTSGAYPAWGGRSFAGYPGAYGVASGWNGLRRSQLGYGYPGVGVSGYYGAGFGAFNPVVNNAV